MQFKTPADIKILEYVRSIGINPDRITYRNYKPERISTTGCNFNIIPPSNNSYLLAYPQITWIITINNFDDSNEINDTFQGNGIWASYKPGLTFSNATSKIEVRINNGVDSMQHLNHLSHILTMMFMGRQGSKTILSTCGGEQYNYDGFHDPGVNNEFTGRFQTGIDAIPPTSLFNLGYIKKDEPMMRNEISFLSKLYNDNFLVALDGENDLVAITTEPLLCSIFNPYFLQKDKHPKYAWWKNTSPLIPLINKLDINITFENLDPSIIFLRYLRVDPTIAVDGKIVVDNLDASLHLYWIVEKLIIEKPLYKIPCWNFMEYAFSLNNGNVLNTGVPLQNVRTSDINLFNYPSLIIIHAEVDKSSPSYELLSLSTDDDQKGNAARFSGDINSLDSFMEIDNLQIILDGKEVLPKSLNQRELHYLTLKNSIMNDFPYEYERWIGKELPSLDDADGTYANPAQCFVALTMRDLASHFGHSISKNITIDFQMDLTGRDGLHSLTGVTQKIYTLYIHFIYGERYCEITKEKAEFKYHMVNMDNLIKTKESTNFDLHINSF